MMEHGLLKEISVCYTDSSNMGDAINKNIIQDVLGYSPICSDMYKCRMSGIGSGLRRFFVEPSCKGNIKKIVKGNLMPGGMIIWSAGFLTEPTGKEIPTRRGLRIASTRGELSRQYVARILGRDVDCSTGDGGLLASELIDMGNDTQKRYSLGIIPHYKEEDCEAFHILAQKKDAVVINVRDNPIKNLQIIASCEAVVSSSLHGLIFCDSLHVPNLHLSVTNGPCKDGFKFRDYYSAFGLDDNSFDVTKIRNIGDISSDMIKSEYRLDYDTIERKKQEIKEAFYRYL